MFRPVVVSGVVLVGWLYCVSLLLLLLLVSGCVLGIGWALFGGFGIFSGSSWWEDAIGMVGLMPEGGG